MSSPQFSKTARHKEEALAGDFDRIARGYDFLCSINPGYHKHLRWSAERLEAPSHGRILDLCCGTGLSTAALRAIYPEAELAGLDASAGMIDQARTKTELGRVHWGVGDATDPAAAGFDRPYDAIFMAYGIRNVPDPDLCLRNLHDLLAPGGTLCLHEYSVADSAWSRFVWNAVTGTIVIPSGLLVTGTTSIFRYLRRSVLEFDGVAALLDRLRQAGYVDVHQEAMDGWQRGVVHSFLARRAS